MQPARAAPKTLRLPQAPACFAYASVGRSLTAGDVSYAIRDTLLEDGA
jgi:hypothetical protein